MATNIITLRSLRLFVSTISWEFPNTQITSFLLWGFWWRQKIFSSVHMTLRTTFSGLSGSRSKKQNFIRCSLLASVKGCRHFGWKKLKRRPSFTTLHKVVPDISTNWDDFLTEFLLFCAIKFEISSNFSGDHLNGAGIVVTAFRWIIPFFSKLASTLEKWWGHSLLACLPVIL